jgi:2,6-dioxo-6-phenylhexa-3-enoate hydrolase
MELMRAIAATFVVDQDLVSEDFLRERLAAASRPEVLEARARSSQASVDLTADLHRIAAETLIIWGRDDLYVPIDHALQLLYRIPRAQLRVFPNCGHWPQREIAADFDRCVLEWFAP